MLTKGLVQSTTVSAVQWSSFSGFEHFDFLSTTYDNSFWEITFDLLTDKCNVASLTIHFSIDRNRIRKKRFIVVCSCIEHVLICGQYNCRRNMIKFFFYQVLGESSSVSVWSPGSHLRGFPKSLLQFGT